MKAALRLTIGVLAALNLSAASVIQFSSTTHTVTEGANQVTITIQRTNDLDTIVSVDFATTQVSATAGSDYVDVVTNLTFAVGEINRTVGVPVLNDGLVEGIETFQALLSNPSGGAVLGPRADATVRITDNDKGLQLELASHSVNEDVGTMTARVVRQDDGDFPVSVDYATTNLAAVAGADYLHASGTLTFAPGDSLKKITVTLLNDAVREPSKTFRLTLRNPSSGAVMGTPVAATVTITDTDELVQFRMGTFTNWEDGAFARLAVVRGESAVASTVNFATADGTAIAGQDYRGLTNTLSFAPGERLKFIDVPLLNDGLRESTETFQVVLSNPTGGTVLGLDRILTVRILDNDPGVGFEDGTASAWEKLPNSTLNVVRGNDEWLEPFTVDYQTVDSTALAGVDYHAASGTLSFAANERVKSIPLSLVQDPAPEASKFFTVALSNLTGQIPMSRSTARVTIVDASQGNMASVQPTAHGGIRKDGSLAEIIWQEPAALSRADAVTGPWERLGAADSPLLTTPEFPGTFYQLRSARPARVYVPSSYDGHAPMPLVVVLHGYGGNAIGMEGYFQFRATAESRGVLLCYPEGTLDRQGARFWNATDACCDFYGTGVEDSAYLRSLIEAIGQHFVVDPKRIYATGLSNGGYMSHRLASDHPDLIAAVAPFAGVTFLDPTSRCPSQPVHVLHIHGTADETVPYNGGSLVGLPVTALFPGAVKTVETWASWNGCQGALLDPAPSLDLIGGAALETTVLRYTNSPPGGVVELWTINGGSHVPALSADFAPRLIDWLLAHPKP